MDKPLDKSYYYLFCLSLVSSANGRCQNSQMCCNFLNKIKIFLSFPYDIKELTEKLIKLYGKGICWFIYKPNTTFWVNRKFGPSKLIGRDTISVIKLDNFLKYWRLKCFFAQPKFKCLVANLERNSGVVDCKIFQCFNLANHCKIKMLETEIGKSRLWKMLKATGC